MNFFNDFHSREGAPEAAPFFTLKEHEARLEQRLRQLQQQAEAGAPAPEPEGAGSPERSPR